MNCRRYGVSVLSPGMSAAPPDSEQGAAADAIAYAEAALAQQNTASSQLDMQVVAAILNAHREAVEGGEALTALQRDIEAAARAETIELIVALPEPGVAVAPALDGLIARGVAGVMIQPSLGLDVIARLALQRRLPAISFRREFAEHGGLMAYAADYAELTRVLAGQVGQLLKGTPVASIPVQQATRFELVVNRKTAATLGIALSPTFLARADEVLE